MLSSNFQAGIRPFEGISVPEPMDSGGRATPKLSTVLVVIIIESEDRTTPFWRDNTCALADFLNLGRPLKTCVILLLGHVAQE